MEKDNIIDSKTDKNGHQPSTQEQDYITKNFTLPAFFVAKFGKNFSK